LVLANKHQYESAGDSSDQSGGSANSEIIRKGRTKLLPHELTGLRRSELFALKWKDVDLAAKHLSVARSIVSQVVGVCKTEASQKPVPLHESLAQALLEWRRHTSFRKREDWVFALNEADELIIRSVVSKSQAPGGIRR
jgi:integrase